MFLVILKHEKAKNNEYCLELAYSLHQMKVYTWKKGGVSTQNPGDLDQCKNYDRPPRIILAPPI